MTTRTTYPIPHRTTKNAAARLNVHGPDDGLSYSLDTISPTSSHDDDSHDSPDVDVDDGAHERTRLTTAPPDDAERRTTTDLETTLSESKRMSKAPLLLRTSPGMGTGSYGAAPVGHSTDEEDGEEEILRRRDKKAANGRHAGSSSRRRRRRVSGSDAGSRAEGSGAAPSPTSTRRP
ncbi:hypothetical protein V492_05420, partial [Pseudogymnoascus sp. VKM F-4246]